MSFKHIRFDILSTILRIGILKIEILIFDGRQAKLSQVRILHRSFDPVNQSIIQVDEISESTSIADLLYPSEEVLLKNQKMGILLFIREARRLKLPKSMPRQHSLQSRLQILSDSLSYFKI